MKNWIYAIAIVFLFGSCFEKIEDDDIVTSEYFEISGDTDFQFTKSSNSLVLTIEGNNCHWWFENIPTWVSLSDVEGNGSKKVTITATEENPSVTEVRQSTMIVRISAFSKEIHLKQDPSEPIVFTVTPTELTFDGLDETKTLKLFGKGSWSISSNKDWCSVNPSSGNGSTEVSVIVTKNNTTEPRYAKLTITTTEKTIEIEISQGKGYQDKPGGNDNPDPTY